MANQPGLTKLTPQCPIRTTLDLLGGKWRLLIIELLADCDRARYRDIKQGIPEISDKVLTEELKTMEQNHLIKRDARRSNAIYYSLTHIGKEAQLLIKPMARFGQSYKRSIGL